MTRYEFQQRAVNRMRGVFEAMDKDGNTAGDAFVLAKGRVLASMSDELDVARDIDFDRFNANYMPDITADTRF